MKQFESPEISVTTFYVEDIITTSGGFGGSGDASGAIGGGAWGDNELPR